MQHTLTFTEILRHFNKVQSQSPNSSDAQYVVNNISSENLPSQAYNKPFKLNAVNITLCTAGVMQLKINLKPITLTPGDVLVVNPDNIVEMSSALESGIEGYTLYLSPEFLNQMTFDSSTLDYSAIQFFSPIVWHLTSTYIDLLTTYFKLLMLISRLHHTTNNYSRNITRSLVAAMAYQLMESRNNNEHAADSVASESQIQQSQQPSIANANINGRRNYYIRDFMTLVSKHFKAERTVSYYAERLYISPKYLSLIVKEATGHTATEWIDHYVILEAKNQLRFSGRNIQQIAYDLNFRNQSSFGKYFKHHTGFSPSQFRKS